MMVLSHIGTFTGLPLWQPIGSATIFMTGSAAGLTVNIADYGTGLTTLFSTGVNTLGSSTGQITHVSQQTAIVTGTFSGTVLSGALAAVLSGTSGPSITAYLGPGGAYSERVELVSAMVAGQQYLFAAQSDGSGFSVLAANGTAQPAWVTDVVDDSASYANGITAMVTVDIGGRTFLYTGSATENGVSGYEIAAGGAVSRIESIGKGDLVPLESVSDLRAVTVAGITYVIVAAAENSSLTVLEVGIDGILTPRDHVIDDLATRFQSVAVMDSLTVSGRSFILAAGADGGISLFTLLPGGTLVHLQSLADQASTTLMDISAVKMVQIGSELQVFVTSSDEAGLTLFRIPLASLGQTLTGSGSSLTGGSGDDMLVQLSGNGNLSGGAGDDILRDGTGADQLRGGSGADRFVMIADGVGDIILDYQPGVDRIDLTMLPYLRNMNQLTIQSITGGAVILYESEVLTVYSSTGQSLTAADFLFSSMINLTRFPITRGVPVHLVQGTVAAEMLSGSGDDEFFLGLDGDDTLVGGGGADQFDGGTGLDIVSYAGMGLSVTVDFTGQIQNAGAAAGHVFTSIEGIIATDFDDWIVADAGANFLHGNAGADWLDCGDGADTVNGGDGNDSILGRDGDDVIFGDGGDDNIAASTGDDVVHGGDGNDSIGGGYGNDQVFGDAGNDTIGAGVGNDLVDGGAGDDIASGGWGNDTVQGGSGNDELAGSYNADVVDGGDGDDNMGGGWGNDTLYGGAGNDTVGAGRDDDLVYGGTGNDQLGGGAGNDQLYGEDGADWLIGGAGNDLLDGGLGNDTLDGGPGADVFQFLALTAGEADRIASFQDTTDLVQIAGIAGLTASDKFAALNVQTVWDGTANVVEILYGGHSITLGGGVLAGQIGVDDFIFV